MQDAIRALLDLYAAVPANAAAGTPAFAGLKAFRDKAPAGTAHPYCVYSCPTPATVGSAYGTACLQKPFVVQFSFFATGKNAAKGTKADDLNEVFVTALTSVKKLTLAAGRSATLRLTLQRLAVLDDSVPDPSSSGKTLEVFHALCQFECFYQVTT